MIPEINVAQAMPDWLDARVVKLEQHVAWCDENRFDADLAGCEDAADDWADERDEARAAIYAIESEWAGWL